MDEIFEPVGHHIYLHAIVAVEFKEALIDPSWAGDLFTQVAGILSATNNTPLVVSGTEDHMHFLINMSPHYSMDGLITEVKTHAKNWVDRKRLTNVPFGWQEGYGAFTISMSQKDTLVEFLKHQEEYHQKVSFLEEFREILHENQLEFEEEDLFHLPH